MNVYSILHLIINIYILLGVYIVLGYALITRINLKIDLLNTYSWVIVCNRRGINATILKIRDYIFLDMWFYDDVFPFSSLQEISEDDNH
jgi:hypothetical protein